MDKSALILSIIIVHLVPEQPMLLDPMISTSYSSVQETSCLVSLDMNHRTRLISRSGSDEGPWNHSFRLEQ